MQVRRQKMLCNIELQQFLLPIYEKKVKRLGIDMGYVLPVTQWAATVYIDRPLTFAILVSCSGKSFTGWSKFNANDSNYTELNGVCRALQRAVDSYLKWELDQLAKEESSLGESNGVQAQQNQEQIS